MHDGHLLVADIYPEIANVRVELFESGKGIDDSNDYQIFDIKNLPRQIKCGNKDCSNGGFIVEHIIEMMIKNELTWLEITEYCFGLDAKSEQGSGSKECNHEFMLRVALSVK